MIGELPCECWALKMPTAPLTKPVLLCVWHGWLKEIETSDVHEAMRLYDAIDEKYADETTTPFGAARDGTS